MKERNIKLDILKGIAIILVFLGHVLQFGVTGNETSSVSGLISIVQMPLFMLVSGYFIVNDKTENFKGLITKIGKKAIAYLIPFFSFMIIAAVRMSRTPEAFITYIKTSFKSVDSGLWFVWVLFFIALVILIADFVTRKLHGFFQFVLLCVCCGILLAPLAAYMFLSHKSYFGVKLILYYFCFAFIGHFIRRYQDFFNRFMNSNLICGKNTEGKGCKVSTLLGFLSISATFLMIIAFVLTDFKDNIPGIVSRFLLGLLSSLAVFSFVNGHKFTAKGEKFLSFIGRYTLEIYYAHCLCIKIWFLKSQYSFYSIEGIQSLLIYASALALLTVIFIVVAKSNPIIDLICFGKTPKNKFTETK